MYLIFKQVTSYLLHIAILQSFFNSLLAIAILFHQGASIIPSGFSLNDSNDLKSGTNLVQPDDPLEKGADKIAEEIVRTNYDNNITKMSNENTDEKKINRKCSKCEDEFDYENQTQSNRKNYADINASVEASDETKSEIKVLRFLFYNYRTVI